jgi:3-hydroxyisobutyrate dehydrogenase-like beta-hydroxyacid dehydrogenase
MSLMLAGDSDVIAQNSSVLEALSDRIFKLGPRLGDGARYKLVNNLVAGMNLIAASEAVALRSKTRVRHEQARRLNERLQRPINDAGRSFATRASQ